MNRLWRIWFWMTKPSALVAWLGTGAKTVPKTEAVRRSKICMDCPGNQPGGSFVETSAGALKHRLNLSVPHEERLKTCRGCGCFIALKIWVPYQFIKQHSRQPEQDKMRAINKDCWQL